MTHPTKIYALYHPATGRYMPQQMWDTTFGYGWSWWEPTGVGGLGGIEGIPRFFKSLAGAKMAMHYWLKGAYYKNRPTSTEVARNPGDLEIHVFELKGKK